MVGEKLEGLILLGGMRTSVGISKSMRTKILLLLALLTLVQISVAETVSSRKMVELITAKPISAKFIRDNPDEYAIIAPATYRVVLSNVKVIQGRPESLPKTIEVDLEANHIEALLKYEQIYLLLDVSGGKYDVLYWEQVIAMACLPSELVDKGYKSYYFPDKWGQKDVECTFIRGYARPDSD